MPPKSDALPYPTECTIPADPPPLPPGETPYPKTGGIPTTFAQHPKSGPSHDDKDRDPYAPLRRYNTVFLIDDSESMKPYWEEVSAVLQAIAGICVKHDPNGIDIYFIHHRPRGYMHGTSSWTGVERTGFQRKGVPHMGDNVEGIFNAVRPHGKCHLARRLDALLWFYTFRLNMCGGPECNRPWNIIVITAGLTEEDLFGPVTRMARYLDGIKAPPDQVGVQFFQVGGDEQVAKALRYFDDELHKKREMRDIVDTVTWTGQPGVLSSEGILKVVLGAVKRTMDRKTVTPMGLLMPETSQHDTCSRAKEPGQ